MRPLLRAFRKDSSLTDHSPDRGFQGLQTNRRYLNIEQVGEGCTESCHWRDRSIRAKGIDSPVREVSDFIRDLVREADRPVRRSVVCAGGKEAGGLVDDGKAEGNKRICAAGNESIDEELLDHRSIEDDPNESFIYFCPQIYTFVYEVQTKVSREE
jgi:hypothetical protein